MKITIQTERGIMVTNGTQETVNKLVSVFSDIVNQGAAGRLTATVDRVRITVSDAPVPAVESVRFAEPDWRR